MGFVIMGLMKNPTYRSVWSTGFLMAALLLGGCESSPDTPPAAAPAATPPPAETSDIVSHQVPYPTFGEIERLDPALDDLIPSDAQLQKLAEGFDWSEGPVWVQEGNYLLFSDIPPNNIYKWDAGAGISLFMHPSGYDGDRTDLREPGSNGLTIDADGALLLAEHGNRRIARLASLADPDGEKTTLADQYEGGRLNSPNDLIVASSGDVYFTDPPYGLAQQMNDPEKELDFQGVYRIRRSGEMPYPVEKLAEQTRPNGIALSPDEQTLYVANSDPQQPFIFAYPVQADGSVGEGTVFFDASELMAQERRGLPDGLKVDTQGNLWATGPGGVLIISPEGMHLGSILTGQATANCAFGEDGSTLFVTADMFLGRIKVTATGVGF